MKNENKEILNITLLEEFISQLENNKAEKDRLNNQVNSILAKAKEAGFNKDILIEMIEIRKVQKDNPALYMQPIKLYENLIKWKEDKEEDSRYSP